MHATASRASCRDKAFVDLDGMLSAIVSARASHASAELVKQRERRLVARQIQLPLELQGRHAGVCVVSR